MWLPAALRDTLRRPWRTLSAGLSGTGTVPVGRVGGLAGSDEESREGELLAHSTIDSLSAHIAILDGTGELIAVNRAWTEFAERNYGSLDRVGVGANYLQVCDASAKAGSGDASAFADGIRTVMSGRRSYFELEYPCHSPTEKRWFVGRVTRFSGANSSRVVVAHENITEGKLAEEALRESEERFRLLAENTNDLICLHDPDGRYVYLSPSCRRLLGYDPEELIGTDPYTLFHPDDARRIRAAAHELALKGQAAVSITYRIRQKSEEYVWFETLTQPITDSTGRVVRLQTSSRDISDRKRAEDALAQEARVRTDFLAEVSHELRTPLTVILGNAEVGLDLERGCAHEEILQEIAKESALMSRMVDDLLFIARSDSLSPPIEVRTVAVGPFLEDLAKSAGALVQQHGATLRTELTGDGLVRVDPSRVKQAVLALADNAAKFSPDGESVTLRSATSGGELCIEVEDEGPGIPEEELPRIFERFYRVDGTRSPGTGLGLSITATIAEVHDGRVKAESSPGRGTRMSLFVPLVPQPQGEETP